MTKPLEGLPSGVQALRYGHVQSKQEHVLVEGRIYGSHQSAALVVKPLPGWEFRWDIQNSCFRAVQRLARPRRVHVIFEFTDSRGDLVIDQVRGLPGFVSVLEGETPPPPKAA